MTWGGRARGAVSGGVYLEGHQPDEGGEAADGHEADGRVVVVHTAEHRHD